MWVLVGCFLVDLVRNKARKKPKISIILCLSHRKSVISLALASVCTGGGSASCSEVKKKKAHLSSYFRHSYIRFIYFYMMWLSILSLSVKICENVILFLLQCPFCFSCNFLKAFLVFSLSLRRINIISVAC